MSSSEHIATIICRENPEKCPRPSDRYRGFRKANATGTRVSKKRYPQLELKLYSHEVMRVGRGIDVKNNVIIDHINVSRQHFMVYSVIYRELDSDITKALVYVRPCKAGSETFVKKPSTRSQKVPCGGFLLSHGDTIGISPYWKFEVHFTTLQAPSSPLSQLQLSESNGFKNRFLITNLKLGSGAYGSVHLAINVRTKTQVACKISRISHPERSRDTIRRILQETNILSRTSHPNILRFVAAFRSPKNLYTFTEIAKGGDVFALRERYEEDGIPEHDTQVIIRQVVSAVSYMHKRGIAHRDIKPENIFFASGPCDISCISRVIVGDLGFVKVKKVSRMASVLGTQGFIAPEILSREPYGVEVDIWSIGMIAIWLASPTLFEGQMPPSASSTTQEAMDRDLDTVFERDATTKNRTIHSDYFKDFVRSCLILEPSERMTADSCENHEWFTTSDKLDNRIKALTKGWKPPNVAVHGVEDLDSMFCGNSPDVVDGGENLRSKDGDDIIPDSQASGHQPAPQKQC